MAADLPWASAADPGLGRIAREDVAAFHIPAPTLEKARARPIGEELWSSATLSPGALAVVVGFPSIGQTLINESPAIVRPQAMLYAANVASRIPKARLQTEIDPEVDVFINYDPKRILDANDGSKRPSIHPRGLSGSAVYFVPGIGGEEIWNLEKLRVTRGNHWSGSAI